MIYVLTPKSINRYSRNKFLNLAAMTICVLYSISGKAAPCDSVISNHISWLDSTPLNYTRNLELTGVSNIGGYIVNPLATYLHGDLYRETSVSLSGNLVRQYYSDRINSGGQPFDFRRSEIKQVVMNGTNMQINGGSPIPVDCEGFLIVGTYTTYITLPPYGIRFPQGTTKYLINLKRREYPFVLI